MRSALSVGNLEAAKRYNINAIYKRGENVYSGTGLLSTGKLISKLYSLDYIKYFLEEQLFRKVTNNRGANETGTNRNLVRVMADGAFS